MENNDRSRTRGSNARRKSQPGQQKRRQYKIGQESSRDRKKRRKKRKKGPRAGDVLSLVAIIIAVAIAAIAGYKLFSVMMEYKAGVDEYSQIADTVITERDPQEEEAWEAEAVDGEEEKHWTPPFDVDFDALEQINSDVVGWLYMEALPDISYPVVQGEDNEYYLHHTYKKEDVFAGSIFIDMKNTGDFSDQNTIVYGHNMKNGSMFGTLKQYRNQEMADESPYFWILTPEDAYKYQIFSVFTAEVGGDTYTLIKGPGQETVDYAESMAEKSELDLGEFSFSATDKIVTLSTCTGNSATRFVVQGVRIYPE